MSFENTKIEELEMRIAKLEEHIFTLAKLQEHIFTLAKYSRCPPHLFGLTHFSEHLTGHGGGAASWQHAAVTNPDRVVGPGPQPAFKGTQGPPPGSPHPQRTQGEYNNPRDWSEST